MSAQTISKNAKQVALCSHPIDTSEYEMFEENENPTTNEVEEIKEQRIKTKSWMSAKWIAAIDKW